MCLTQIVVKLLKPDNAKTNQFSTNLIFTFDPSCSHWKKENYRRGDRRRIFLEKQVIFSSLKMSTESAQCGRHWQNELFFLLWAFSVIFQLCWSRREICAIIFSAHSDTFYCFIIYTKIVLAIICLSENINWENTIIF